MCQPPFVEGGFLDIIHLLLLAGFEEFLESNGIGCFFEGLLQLSPGVAQFDGALRVTQSG